MRNIIWDGCGGRIAATSKCACTDTLAPGETCPPHTTTELSSLNNPAYLYTLVVPKADSKLTQISEYVKEKGYEHIHLSDGMHHYTLHSACNMNNDNHSAILVYGPSQTEPTEQVSVEFLSCHCCSDTDCAVLAYYKPCTDRSI